MARVTELFRRVRRLFTILIPVLALGCSSLPGIVGAVDSVLAVLCETREALHGAREALERGDVYAAIDMLKAYLVEHGHDEEVAAALQLLEAQVRKVQRTTQQ